MLATCRELAVGSALVVKAGIDLLCIPGEQRKLGNLAGLPWKMTLMAVLEDGARQG